MLIDPQGLLHGDRVAACSDEAQLHFPRLLAASNTFGRFRMSVDWLQGEVYGSFHAKPSKEQMTAWLREYHANFLLFIYKAHDGSMWAQWDVPEKLLGQYRAAADRKTPAPAPQELEAFRNSYVESLRARNKNDLDIISEGFGKISETYKTFYNVLETSQTVQNVLETYKTFENISDDVLVGVGVGVGVAKVQVQVPVQILAPATPAAHTLNLKSSKVTDPRHITFRAAVKDHWRALVGVDAPWDGSEGKALASMLRAMPNFTLEQFNQCLKNRALSDVQPSDRPRKWLECVTDYLSGPKDAYGKPKGNHATSGQRGAGENPARGRNQRSSTAIANVFGRIRAGAGFDADGPDKAQLSEPGNTGGNGRDVGSGVDRPGDQVRTPSDTGGTWRTPDGEPILPTAVGVARTNRGGTTVNSVCLRAADTAPMETAYGP